MNGVRAYSRDADLDAVKGFLVLAMALYHCMNYFGEVPDRFYGYLRFVNGSFVFISGFVVAAYYSGATASPRADAGMALAGRGLKLLGLFTALNLAAAAVSLTNYRNVSFGISDYFQNSGQIYGCGDTSQIAFRILVPIAYVLVLSGLFSALPRGRPALIVVALVLAGVFSVSGVACSNAFFLLTGLLGLTAGLLSRTVSPSFCRSWCLIGVGCAALATLMNVLSSTVLTYSLGLAVFLKLVYDGARRMDRRHIPHQTLVLLGRYSLLCYVAQIGFLFLLQRGLRGHSMPLGLATTLGFAAACAFMLLLCKALDTLRPQSRLIEKTYRLVFA